MPSPTGQPGQVEIQGSDVGVQIQISNASDFNTMMADAEGLGLQVTDSSAAYGIVEGYLPIAELPSAAELAARLPSHHCCIRSRIESSQLDNGFALRPKISLPGVRSG